MLLVDYREGSKDLKEPLRAMGLPVTAPEIKDDLDSGDLAWIGRGEKGEKIWIGIEFKKLGELMQSLRSNRVNEQALRMQHEFRFRYLMIEGELIMDKKGHMMRRSAWNSVQEMPGLSAGELFKRIYVLHIKFGLVPIFVPDRRMALKQIEFLYRVWTDQDQDQHKSHLGIYEPPLIVEPSGFVRTVKTFPECGLKIAAAAEKVFRTIRRAVNANADEWAAIETVDERGRARRLGSSNAAKIIDHLTT